MRCAGSWVDLHAPLFVDIGLDSSPNLTPTKSVLSPTFAPEELAARNLAALFDRAMPCDLVDLFRLARDWDRDDIMSWYGALQIDTSSSDQSRGA